MEAQWWTKATLPNELVSPNLIIKLVSCNRLPTLSLQPWKRSPITPKYYFHSYTFESFKNVRLTYIPLSSENPCSLQNPNSSRHLYASSRRRSPETRNSNPRGRNRSIGDQRGGTSDGSNARTSLLR